VGRLLGKVAQGGQALCVTHLAQVAVRADHQLQVSKQSSKDSLAVDAKGRKHGSKKWPACWVVPFRIKAAPTPRKCSRSALRPHIDHQRVVLYLIAVAFRDFVL
jgi:hypothetical protein